MKTTTLLLNAIFVIAINSSCKKQVVEQSSDHFFANMTTDISINARMTLETEYNNSNGNIVIDHDSIVVKRAGLYHFEGRLDIRCFVENPAAPGQFKLTLGVFPDGFTYYLCNVLTTITSSTNAIGQDGFSTDVYLRANTRVQVHRFLYNINRMAGATINGHFSGYRKSN